MNKWRAGGLLGGVLVPLLLIEPWVRRTERADPAWGYPLDPALAPGLRAALAAGLAIAVFAGARWVLSGPRRLRAAVALVTVLAASLTLHFPRHGGDGVGDLVNKATAWDQGGSLFTGGELLGYFAYNALIPLWPGDPFFGVFVAARVIGALGLVGMAALGWALSRGEDQEPGEGAAVIAALLCTPFVLLLGPYPQSTSLMNALVPGFLAVALLALGAEGQRRSRLAVGAGVLLGLAVGAHGSAWFLGLGAAVACVALGRVRLGDGARFAGGFLVPAGIAFVIDASWDDRRASAWGFTDFDGDKLMQQFGGPLQLFGNDEHFGRGYGDELTAWLLSAAPAVGLGVVAAAILLIPGQRRSNGGIRNRAPFGSAIAFLTASTAGSLLLWSGWDVWFGYPSDWDITALLALCLQALTVALIAGLRRPELRAAALGACAGISAYAWVGLTSLFSAA